MNTNYLKALDKLASTITEVEKLSEIENKSFEDKQICNLVENIIDEMKYTINRIEYYKKTPTHGTLKELLNKRFDIAGHELTCGNPLEVYSDKFEEWFVSRVEHSDRYYVHCDVLENLPLCDGMEARIRL